MNLADSLPTQARRVNADRVLAILWFSGACLVGVLLVLFLLHRIGLPTTIVHSAFAIFFAIGVAVLAWLGRTIVSPLFFFARNTASTSSVGLGGSADWISGSFLVLLLGLNLDSRYVIVPALVLGLIFQASLFAMAFRRTGVATLPGFFEWRYGSQLNSMVTLIVSIVVMAALLLAEFSVARDVMGNLASMDPSVSGMLVLILAAIPALLGGWLSLLIVNATLAVGLLICILVQASLVAFLPTKIVSIAAPSASVSALAALDYPTSVVLGGGDATTVFLSIAVLGAGFSVRPHSFSRIAVVRRPVDALRMLSFSALIVFLVMAVFPLSIGLIAESPSSQALANTLESQQVLLMLPHIALLFAAFNGLSVTMLVIASSIMRGIRRSRRQDPGEQSVFATRALTLAVGGLVYVFAGARETNAGELLITSLAIGAGGFFFPTVAAVWISRIPGWVNALACAGGAASTGAGLYLKIIPEPAMAALAGLAVSLGLLVLGRLGVMVIRKPFSDPKLMPVRVPDDTL